MVELSWNFLATLFKLAWNFLETSLKYLWNTHETALNHHWNFPDTPIKLFYNTLETHLKLLETPLNLTWCTLDTFLKHPWNFPQTFLEHYRSFRETPFKFPWNFFVLNPYKFLETSLKLSWNPFEALHTLKSFLKYHWNTLELDTTQRTLKEKRGKHTEEWTHWVTTSLLELLIAAKKIYETLGGNGVKWVGSDNCVEPSPKLHWVQLSLVELGLGWVLTIISFAKKYLLEPRTCGSTLSVVEGKKLCFIHKQKQAWAELCQAQTSLKGNFTPKWPLRGWKGN